VDGILTESEIFRCHGKGRETGGETTSSNTGGSDGVDGGVSWEKIKGGRRTKSCMGIIRVRPYNNPQKKKMVRGQDRAEVLKPEKGVGGVQLTVCKKKKKPIQEKKNHCQENFSWPKKNVL